MSKLHEYQVDHLLLLVGSNPVPNAVAGKLLIVKGGTITLIHPASERPSDQASLVRRLEKWFGSDYSVRFQQVEESDADSVRTSVLDVLDDYEDKVLKDKPDSDNANKERKVRIGLNYTGGTKVMSVHAYRALESWINERDNEGDKRHPIIRRDPVFSYLDARTLQMRIDPSGGKGSRPYVGREVKISIDQLLAMHSWVIVKGPTRAPVLPKSAADLLAIYSNSDYAKK